MSERKKCIVKGCSNHEDEGRFIGDLCAPCHTYLKSGFIGPTNSFLGDLRNELKSAKDRLKKIQDLTLSFK